MKIPETVDTWLDMLDAIESCLENDIRFATEKMANAPPDQTARKCLDIEDPTLLSERQRNVVSKFILPRLHEFHCSACSTPLQFSEFYAWFDNGNRCSACEQRG